MGLSRANNISSSWPEIAEFGTASPFLVQIVFQSIRYLTDHKV
ncbi:hypothetical protein LPL9_2160 [Lacticaseibacillus paracasei]|nr:hypothetical protein LPL9_2160 [Lacticaseibacillus paracasei]